jgi:hyperosmotically inducible periplasmic protein
MHVIAFARRRQRRKLDSLRDLVLPLAASAATGAIVMFLADPDRGKRRRAIVRDRTFAAIRRSGRRANKLSHRTEARISGLASWALHLSRGPEPVVDDQMLTDRIMSRVFRDREIPRGRININVEDGVAVLRGQLEKPEQIRELQEAVEHVPGVRDVESYLHLPKMTAPNKEQALSHT